MANNLIIISTLLTLALSIGLQDAYTQGRQIYPRINEEEWIEVNPGERYNCPTCEMIFQGTEFTIWEHLDGDRVIVAVPITDNKTFINEGFIYNFCFGGEDNDLLNLGSCEKPEYEKYKVE